MRQAKNEYDTWVNNLPFATRANKSTPKSTSPSKHDGYSTKEIISNMTHSLVSVAQKLDNVMSSKAVIPLIEEKLDTIQALLYANKPILTSSEVCEYLCIDEGFLNMLTRKKRIPYYHPFSKCNYFKRDEIDAWALNSPRLLLQNMKHNTANA